MSTCTRYLLVTILFLLTLPISITAQPILNQYNSGDTAHYLCDKGIIQIGTGAGTGCWGYRAPDGTEYAIYGVYEGIAVVNTANMTVVDIIPGPVTACGSAINGPRWREMRVYNHFAYITSECAGTNAGLMVIDLENLPDSVSIAGIYPTNGVIQVASHSLSIDTTNGFAYLEGITTASKAIYIHDLANPAVPVYVNSFGIAGGIHDMTALDDTLYIAEGWNVSFSIYDMADKMSPALITRVPIPGGGYMHNLWPSDDRRYLVTTEETADKTLKIWDMQDIHSISLIGEILGPSHVTHNAYWKGDRVYTSHYEAGAVIFDVSDPTNPTVELQYDTWPTNFANFRGAWGGYPYTNNGTMYISNTDGKLFVIEERTDVIHDTMWTDAIIATNGTEAEVTISASNSHPVRQFQIPVSWPGTSTLHFVDLDRTETRTEYFQSETTLLDSSNNRMVIMLSGGSDSIPPLPAGSGPVVKVRFAIPGNASAGTNMISFTDYPDSIPYEPSFASHCLAAHPVTASGAVQVVSCCTGIRGDANNSGGNATIADLTFLVSYLFNSGPMPACFEEGNANGIGKITIADVTYLVQYLYAGGPPPATCPF